MIRNRLLLMIPAIILVAALYACRQSAAAGSRVVVVQPLGTISMQLVDTIAQKLRAVHQHVIVRHSVPLPTAAYYKPRSRFRADTLIRYLAGYGSRDTVVIGITAEDISTTKNGTADWGVMGLGYTPGNACVASTFRLAKNNRGSQLYKVAIHELGHTQGLPHCRVSSCYMRDANGSNPLNEEKEFCPACRNFLRRKGWNLK